MSPKPNAQERRSSPRRAILDSFSVFVVIPKKGGHRLTVQDVSDQGIGFHLDVDGESAADFPLDKGESLDIHFYVNQSLYLPLKIQVARIEGKGAIRRLGAEFKDRSSKSFKAFKAFLEMIDHLVDAGHSTSQS